MLQTSDPEIYGNLNKELFNGSYLGRDKYPTTSRGAYELMVHRPVIYQSIGNGDNGGVRRNSNGNGNQHNQRQHFMFLQQESNGVNSNSFPPEYQLFPGKDG